MPARPPLKARWMELFDIVSASVPNLMRWLRLMVPYETPALRCLYACLFLLGRNVRVSHRAAGRGSLRGRRGAGYAGWPGFKAPRRWVAFYGLEAPGIDVNQEVEAALVRPRAPPSTCVLPRSARRKGSRQPACNAMRLLCARVLVLSLRCGPSDGRGGAASAAAIRQARLVHLPCPSMHPRRTLLPPAPLALCAPRGAKARGRSRSF